jgi:large subunit ribosomal protein L25
MEEIIVVKKREKVGKVETNRMRKEGFIPATVYGLNEPAVSIAISPKVVAKVLSSDAGMNSVMFVQREGTDIKRHVIIKAVQRSPRTGRLVHIDFMRIDPTHKVRISVPIRLKGTPVGTKEGGILDFIHRVIEVECLPAFIPPHIDVDVTDMKVGDTLRLDQVVLDAHVTLHGDPHNVICTCQGKRASDEELAAEAAPAAAPEAAPAKAAPKGKK